jgi:NADH-quinone oxidoreductase subunit M
MDSTSIAVAPQLGIFGIDILSVLIFGPALGGLILMLLPQNKWLARVLSLAFAILIGGAAVAVFFVYQQYAPKIGEDQYILQVSTAWFSLIGANWHLGIDGISAAMVLLTGILTPLAILISWEIEDRPNTHLALLLFFETGLMGVFVSMDLMVFFLFYELSLVPMYFVINQWGGPNRQYASTKFMIYSIGGTLGMLLATQLIGFTVGTYSIAEITRVWPTYASDAPAFLGISVGTVKALAFAGFFIAFCIKVPIWPFHTWLPDAHGEAPTAGSMLLAGVMLKLGAYGFLRLVIPFFPDVWVSQIPLLGISVAMLFAILAMLGIVLGAYAAFGQNDIKRLVAYSSVNHMGFVGLGLAVMAQFYGESWVSVQSNGVIDPHMMQNAIIATNGAVLQMFNHGLSSAGMFLLAGGIYHKTHTRNLDEYGGLWVKAPIFGVFFIYMSMASLGLPGLNGFVSEFLVVRGSWGVFTGITIVSMIGLLFTGSYILKGIRAVLHGPFNMHWKDYNLEIELREVVAIAPLMVLILVTGVVPNWILSVINNTVTHILNGIG